MKRIVSYIMMAMVAMIFASCQKDMKVFTAELESYDGGNEKVYIDQETDFSYACWSNGDKVNVNGGVETLTVDNKTSTIKIDKSYISNQSFTASFPNTDKVEIGKIGPQYVEDGKVLFNMGKYGDIFYEYKLDNEGRQIVNAPMVAYAGKDEHRLKFKNVGALMAISVTNNTGADINMQWIELTTTSEQPIGGKIMVDIKSNSNEPSITLMGGSSNIVTARLKGEEVESNHGSTTELPMTELKKDATGRYYIPILPVNSIFKIDIVYKKIGENDFRIFERKSTINDIKRNELVRMGVTLSNDNSHKWNGDGKSATTPILIESALDLEMMARKCGSSNGFVGKFFKQTKDITLPPDFIGIGNSENNSNLQFHGNYDGDGHTIATSKPVFNYVSNGANIHNLTVDGDLEGLGGSDTRGILIKKVLGTEQVIIDDCHTKGVLGGDGLMCGGLCGRYENTSLSSKITNCTNEATIEASQSAGSMCGECASGAKVNIVGCINSGKMSAPQAGGMVGIAYTTVTVKKCINTGEIEAKSSNLTLDGKCGGIIGYCSGSSILECANHGNITSKYAGGLCGVCYGGKITNSYSDGHIIRYKKDNMTGGICGQIDGNVKLNNVYVGSNNDGNPDAWIAGDETTNNCTNVYRPDDNGYDFGNDSNGNTTKYNSDWKLSNDNSKSLLDALNENCGNDSHDLWKDGGSDKPILSFEQ